MTSSGDPSRGRAAMTPRRNRKPVTVRPPRRTPGPRHLAQATLAVLLLLVSMVVPLEQNPVTEAEALLPPEAEITLVSRIGGADTGGTGPGESRDASLSADGTAVGFVSDNELHEEAGSGYRSGRHVWVTLPRFDEDLARHDTVHVVIDPAMDQIIDPADVVVSDRGLFVAFTAQRDPDNPDAGRAVYTADVAAGAITRVDPDHELVTGSPTISDDGRTIAYDAAPQTHPDARQVRVWERDTREITVASRAGDDLGNHPSTGPALAGDGKSVAFTTAATNLVAGTDQPRHDGTGTEAVVRDLRSGTITLLSHTTDSGATAPAGDSWIPGPDALSQDGRWAVFATDANAELFDTTVAADHDDEADIIRRDTSTASGRLISRNGNNTCDGTSPQAAVDADGGVVYASTCTDLTDFSDVEGANVYQSDGSSTTIVDPEGSPADSADPDVSLLRPTTSADGTAVAWTTIRSHPYGTPGQPDRTADDNNRPDVYLSAPRRAKKTVTPVPAKATDIRDACPAPGRTVTTDDPESGVPVALRDPDLPLSFTITPDFDRDTESHTLRLRGGPDPDDHDPAATDPVRAIVAEYRTDDDETVFVRWDEGIDMFRSHDVAVPIAEVGGQDPVSVGVCAPAVPEYGPHAHPDTAMVHTGRTVTIDVLANDEGDIDPSTLQVLDVTDGSAEVVDDGDGNPVVAYTAPDDDGEHSLAYEISDHDGTTVSGLVSIEVGSIDASPLELTAVSEVLEADTPGTVEIHARNDTGDTVTGAVVTVVIGDNDELENLSTAWTCETVADGALTCTTDAAVDDGDTFAPLVVETTVPGGPKQACDHDADPDLDPDTDACIRLLAWNGGSGDFGRPESRAITEQVPYNGPVFAGSIEPHGPLEVDSPGTYHVTVTNTSNRTMPAGAMIEIRAAGTDMPFVSSDSDRFSCEAADDDPQRVICTTGEDLAGGDHAVIPVIFSVPAEPDAECAEGTDEPCAVVTVAWIDDATPPTWVQLDQTSDHVGEQTNPIPPDVTVQLTAPTVAWSDTEVALRVATANAGLGPTTGPITAELELPTGFIPTGASGTGWDCQIEDRVTCEREEALAAGAHAPTITVLAEVGADAASGAATATVHTPDDADPTNDTMSRDLEVRDGDPENPDGPLQLSLRIDGDMTISPDATIDQTITLANDGTDDAEGPHTIAMLMPDGRPAGQRITAEGAAPWQCVDTALTGVRELRCTIDETIAPGDATSPLDLEVTGDVLTPGGTLDLAFTHELHDAPQSLINRLLVTRPQVAQLSVSSTQATPLRPGGRTDLMVSATNVGNAAPTGEVETDLELPDGVTAGAITGDGWSCETASGGTGTLRCTNDNRPSPGMDLPTLRVELEAAADADPVAGPATVRTTSTDTIDRRTHDVDTIVPIEPITTGEMTIERTGLDDRAEPAGPLTYQIGATNVGRAGSRGTLRVVEQLPAGTVVEGHGDGWSCHTVSSTLTCERPDIALAPGQSIPTVQVEADIPAGLAGGSGLISGTVAQGGFTGVGLDAIPRVDPADLIEWETDLHVGIEELPSDVVRGGTGTATLRVENNGNLASEGPTTIGAALSRGLVPTDPRWTSDGWSCYADAGASRSAVVCQHPDGVPAADGEDAGSLPEVTLEYDVTSAADSDSVIEAGFVTGENDGTEALLAALQTLLGKGPVEPAWGDAHQLNYKHRDRVGPAPGLGRGTPGPDDIAASVLADPSVAVLAVRDLEADAGPDQAVPERRPDGDTTVPTVVRLDGRGSSSGSGDIDWTWVQTEGPDVEWSESTVPVFDAGGSVRPVVGGANPSFEVPRLADSSSVDLVFEMTVTAWGASRTDTVTVTVTPSPDAAPVMDQITADPDGADTSPDPGDQIDLVTAADDPEGDPVTVRWEVASSDGDLATATITGDDEVITTAGGQAHATLKWPQGASYVVVEATGTSSRGAAATTSVVLGSATPPPSISLDAPEEAAAGQTVEVTATVGAGDPDDWRWEQISGPDIDPDELNAATGPDLTFTAPSVGTGGQAVQVRAVATRINGAASAAGSATATIDLAPLAAPEIGISGDTSVSVGASVTLTATGVPDGSTVRWSQKAGPVGVLGSADQTSTTFTGVIEGVVGVEVTVTDPTGRTTSASTQVTVGAPVIPSGSVSCEAAGSLLNKVFEKAAAGELMSATVGPISLTLGGLSVQAPCGDTDPAAEFSDSTISLAGGKVTGSSLSGTVSTDGVCITGGEVRFPDSWGLEPATVDPDDPLCIAPDSSVTDLITGSLKTPGMPLVDLPSSFATPTTTVTFEGSSIGLAAELEFSDDDSVELAATVELDTGHFTGLVDGELTVQDTPIDFSGRVSHDHDGLDFDVEGTASGPITLAPGTTLADVELRMDRDGFALDGTVAFGDHLEVDAHGRYRDTQNWSLSVSADSDQDQWSPRPGLDLPTGAFRGKVQRDEGDLTYDVSAKVPGDWEPVDGLTLSNLTARLSNETAPADCPVDADGSGWLAVSGAATAAFGSAEVTLDGAACVIPGESAWSFSTTANLNSWKPVSSLDVTVESVGLRAAKAGSGEDVEVTAFGSARAMGANLGGVVSAKSGSVVVDGFGNLEDLNSGASLGKDSTGHVLFASAARSAYRFFDFDIGAIPEIDPDLSAVDVANGVSLYIPTTLSDDIRSVIQDNLKLPDVSNVVLSVNLGGGVPVLRASISLGDPGQGYNLYENCGEDPCADADEDDRSALDLNEIAITLSGSGSIGFEAAATLALAASGETPASTLDMTAAITVDVAGPKIAVALYTTDGTWHGALGKDGLDLSELAVQAGVDFSVAIPTPSVGFGAHIDRLPDDWAETIGMDPDNQEPLYFGINLSVSAPIVDLQIGVKDGNTVIDPLHAIAPGVLEIDYASLVIAPMGGSIGARTYDPGMSLGFAATIAGVDFDAAFAVDVLRGSVSGELSLGPISMAGMNITDVEAAFDIDPTNTSKPFSYMIQGRFELPPMGDAPATASGHLEVTATGSGLQAELDLEASNVGLAGIARLSTFELHGLAAVGTGGIEAFELDLVAVTELLGTEAGFEGHIEIADNRLISLSVAGSLQANLGQVGLTGPGCGGALPDQGACVTFAMEGKSIAASIDATMQVKGFSVDISGEFTNAYIRASGAIDLGEVGDFEISGALYFGSSDQLDGVTETDLDGNEHQVSRGDFKFTAAGQSGSLGGFGLSAAVAVLRLGSNVDVHLEGQVTVPGGQVRGQGTFSYEGTTLTYDFDASGSLVIDGHELLSVDVAFARDSSGFSAGVDASVSLPLGIASAEASLSGEFSQAAGGRLLYDLTGAVDVDVAGMALEVDLEFSNSHFGLRIYLGNETVFDVTVEGHLDSSGDFSLSAGTTVFGLGALVEVARSGSDWSFRAQLSYQEHTLAWTEFGTGGFTAAVDFAAGGSGSAQFTALRVGGDFSVAMNLQVTISTSSGVSARFSGSGSVAAWYQVWGPINGWGPQRTLLDVGASVESNGDMCATIKAKELCI